MFLDDMPGPSAPKRSGGAITGRKMTDAQIRERDARWTDEARVARERHQRLTEAAAGNAAALAVIVLHKPNLNHGAGDCEGCDGEGYEYDFPAWPCRTTVKLEEVFGLTAP